MGKYDDVNATLPKYRPTTKQEQSYQDKVKDQKAVFLKENPAPTAADLVREYVKARTRVETVKRELSDANLELEAIVQLLTGTFEDEDITSLKVPGATVRVETAPHAVVKDKTAFRLWCIKNKLADSLQLPWSTTNSILKERLIAGKPEPDGVTAFQKDKVVLTRDKKG